MTQSMDDAETGRVAGLGAGILAGAQIGTAFIPIPFVGTVTGAVVGGAVGSKLGQRIAPTLTNAFNQVVGQLQPSQKGPASATPSSSVPITRETSATDDTLIVQLEQLGKLRDQGVLTDEEFSAAKARLLKA